jgi:DNA-directed RNA polymerase subunit RPC12/RpoP
MNDEHPASPRFASPGATMPADGQSRIGWEIRANLVCTLCARTVARASGPNTHPLTLTAVRVLDASHAEAVRRLRCPHCSGRVWLQDYEEIYVARHALTGEDLRPRRGRPRKVSTAS